ncbi:cell filamentation protein Fic [Streptococcus sp. zg-86]|uniref:protein adenylyltransferase n=1 Tax=Streptococcus zhangguiae TaxID=2664091 RepID=A0A6I4RTI8_9STRE|nr:MULTISPECIES: Fic family protein [unclassified Streptococcus]MTB64245.1 cell filamentation protein Fic [Streptococcus sp. zg-86]MTB90429.1 cell filamentation protein Fic [Streptococcus sp. zg-36]MWV56232.1 cell filamentation protein Fic [Streptococcus sp. zg-70]QTH48146.1 Fic family protein [Streptococcus sp. zg-86]
MQPTYSIDNPRLSYQTKLDLWETGFGLQKVDGLEPSAYMIELAQSQAKGDLTYQDVHEEIRRYHAEVSAETQEADLVALRIAELLSRRGFSFSPGTLLSIHKELFQDIFPDEIPVGTFRRTNISKKEYVLGSDSVVYADYTMIEATLDYDFTQEKKFAYQGLTKEEIVAHIQQFISGIWQIHPFREGNTRAVIVFLIQYLREFGFDVDNEPFQKNARFFRDALVLDNAKMLQKNSQPLTQFFENLLLNGQNDLIL